MLREKPPPGQEDGFSELSSAGCLENSENRPPRPNTQIKFQAPAEFDVEIALALAASGWRVAAHLLILTAKCVEAGDFQSAENNRRQAREQFNTATDVFRQFQEARAAKGTSLLAKAFL